MDMSNLSPKNRIILMILLPFIVLALFYTFYLADTMDQITKLKKDNDALKMEIDRANQVALRYEQIKATNQELLKKMDYLKTLLPRETEVSDLLKKVSEQGIQKGLQVNLWRPKGKLVHESKEIYQIPVEVKMRGKYHTFGSFFAEIAKIERIVNVQSIELRAGTVDEKGEIRGGVDPTNLFANLTITTYSIIPDEEKKKLQETQAKK